VLCVLDDLLIVNTAETVCVLTFRVFIVHIN
jgi:hypothetical protein